VDEEAVAKQMIDRLAEDLFRTLCGSMKPNRPTMLRYRNGRFESVELDDFYQPIEPPTRCPKCGPVLCCSEHMVVT
jgi:hypothetical protein